MRKKNEKPKKNKNVWEFSVGKIPFLSLSSFTFASMIHFFRRVLI